MPIVTVVVILIVIGFLLWLANTYIPMQIMIQRILNGFVVIAVVLWLVNLYIPLGGLGNVRIGR